MAKQAPTIDRNCQYVADTRFGGIRRPAILAFMVFLIMLPHWIGLSMMMYVGMGVSATLWAFLAMKLDEAAVQIFNNKEHMRISLNGALAKLHDYGYPDTDPTPPEKTAENNSKDGGT